MDGQLTTVPMGVFLFWPIPLDGQLYRLVPNDKLLTWEDIRDAVGVYVKVRRTSRVRGGQESILVWKPSPHHITRETNEQREVPTAYGPDSGSD